MELDNLKELWKGQYQNDAGAFTDQNVLRMLKKQSQLPIATMKRNVLVELMIGVVLSLAIIFYYLIVENGIFWMNSVFMSAFMIVAVLYYYRKFMLLKQMENNDQQISISLNRQLKLLKSYIHFYKWSGIILMPVTYLVTVSIILYSRAKRDYPEDSFMDYLNSYESLNKLLIAGIFILVISPIFNQWYAKRLYGDHVRKLEDLVRQANEV